MRLHRNLIALAIAGAMGAAALPASANPATANPGVRVADSGFSLQFHIGDRDGRRYGHRHRRVERLSPRQVRRILRRSGYQDIHRPNYQPRRNAYVVRAENRRGRDVRVVVSAFNGRILDVDRLGRGRGDHRRGRGRRS